MKHLVKIVLSLVWSLANETHTNDYSKNVGGRGPKSIVTLTCKIVLEPS